MRKAQITTVVWWRLWLVNAHNALTTAYWRTFRRKLDRQKRSKRLTRKQPSRLATPVRKGAWRDSRLSWFKDWRFKVFSFSIRRMFRLFEVLQMEHRMKVVLSITFIISGFTIFVWVNMSYTGTTFFRLPKNQNIWTVKPILPWLVFSFALSSLVKIQVDSEVELVRWGFRKAQNN